MKERMICINFENLAVVLAIIGVLVCIVSCETTQIREKAETERLKLKLENGIEVKE